jgi:nucleoprotein TPR
VLALEDNFRSHKETYVKNTQQFRTKMGELNNQKSALADEKRQLEAKVSSLEQENSTLQASLASKPSAPPPSPAPASVSPEETQKQNALIVSNLSIIRNHQADDCYPDKLTCRTR